ARRCTPTLQLVEAADLADAFAARAGAEAVDPHRTEAARERAVDVARHAVADHHRVADAEQLERVPEDRRVRLADAEVAGDGDRAEPRLEPRRRELLALQARGAVGDERDRAVDRIERGLDVVERVVARAALDAEPLAQLLRQRRVFDALLGQRARPRAAPV